MAFLCLLAAPHLEATAAASVPVSVEILYDPAQPTTPVRLSWEAIPTKHYQLLTTPALGQAWEALSATPVVASNNLVRFAAAADPVARFYQVAKLDTEAPEIWRTIPSSNAIAVTRQSAVQVFLDEETGLDRDSVALTVGTNPPVTLADPRLVLVGNVLTYTPAANEVLGANGQTLTNRLVIADTLGQRMTHAWPFKLELTPVLVDNVVLISAGSPLTLVSTNGDTFVFAYTGASSGLTNGAIVVSTDAAFPYKRVAVSATEDPAAHTVSLVTTPASLADILKQGSVRFYAAEFVPVPEGPGVGLHGGDEEGITIPLGGQTLCEGETVKVETTAGRLQFDPGFSVAADFDWSLSVPPVRMTSFDLDISAEMAFDLTLRASWEREWTFAPEPRRIGRALRQVRLLGVIPTPIPIPVWAEAVWEFSVGTEGEVTGLATATAGFESTTSLAFGTRLRDGKWEPYSRQSLRAVGYPATWQGGGSGRIRGFVEPKLTVYLESLVGPTANLRPYLELIGNACVQPGQKAVDVSLFPGINGTLALALRGWDEDWGELPSWELFDVRPVTPIWHKLLPLDELGTPVSTYAGNLVWIPCGTFTMGSPDSEPVPVPYASPQTRVTISRGFWMGKYEVTQAEYAAVMGSNPSYFNGDRRGMPYSDQDYGTDWSRPVEQVSWNDAVTYCAALTARERSAGRLPAGYVYRLPTEAEWEYACRAGTTTSFHYGSVLRSGMANFDGRDGYPPCGNHHWTCWNPSAFYLWRTTAVGSYAPNAWGLHDMHGNVWEWCQDWWASSLPGGSETDPQGPASGSHRVFRGGNWHTAAIVCHSAWRSIGHAAHRYGDRGFRVVLAPSQP